MTSEMVVPQRPGLPDVLAGAFGAAGLESRSSIDFGSAAAGLELPSARRVCVVLVDGLGAHQLTSRSGHFPFLRKREMRTMTSVAPSTTAAAITAFGTAALPGATGMLGYTVRRPGTDELLNMIRWDEDLLAMTDWQTVPTLAEQLAAPSRFVTLAPARFAGSGLTLASLRGARSVPGESLAERVDSAVAELSSGRADVAYLYWGEVDHVGHVSGWKSWQWGEEASATDSEMARLARSLPAGTLLIVTADHGMVDVTSSVDVREDPVLGEGVRLVAGEPRAMHLFCDADPTAVAARWADRLGDGAWVLPREEALPLFGPLDSRFAGSIGDVVVFMRGTGVVVDSATQTPSSMALIGVHGSLTPEEMYVPLIVAEC